MLRDTDVLSLNWLMELKPQRKMWKTGKSFTIAWCVWNTTQDNIFLLLLYREHAFIFVLSHYGESENVCLLIDLRELTFLSFLPISWVQLIHDFCRPSSLCFSTSAPAHLLLVIHSMLNLYLRSLNHLCVT